MLEFLNNNSGTIQAVATIVLVAITWRYVALTRHLATIARDQLDLHRQALQASSRQAQMALRFLVKRLHETVKSLPHDIHTGEKMREVAMWEAQDLKDLESLAAQFSPEALDHTAKAVQCLRYLNEKVIGIKETPRPLGVDWKRFPWDHWFRDLSEVEKSFSALADLMK